MSRDRAWDRVEIRRPAAAGFEFMGRSIEGGIAAGASIDTTAGHVLVIRAGIGGFGTLLTEDTELLYVGALGERLESSKLQASNLCSKLLAIRYHFL